MTRLPLAPPTTATGALTLQATVRDRRFDVGLSLQPGQVVAVLGANGAGKSTLLALIAGLLRPDSGRIDLDGHTLVDTAVGTWTPPHQRGVVLLAQEALLFPHLSAAANVAFGPRSRGLGARAAQARATQWLTAVDAVELADRRPSQLSGGQAQRIAIARALATDPALLLLDEPMAALDVAVAPALRLLLRSVLRGTGRTALLVTHDILDALSLADRVVVMEDGQARRGRADALGPDAAAVGLRGPDRRRQPPRWPDRPRRADDARRSARPGTARSRLYRRSSRGRGVPAERRRRPPRAFQR